MTDPNQPPAPPPGAVPPPPPTQPIAAGPLGPAWQPPSTPSAPPTTLTGAPPAGPYGAPSGPSRRAPRPGMGLGDSFSLPVALVAVGVALLSAGVVVGVAYDRAQGQLDGSVFTVGLLCALGLLGVAAAARFVLPDAEADSGLVSWPGAFGVVGLGFLIATAITNDTASQYVTGLLILALSVGGYLLVARTPFVITAVLGLAILFSKVFSQISSTGSGHDNTFMTIGAGVLIFVLLVSAAAWFLPESRVAVAVTVGVGGVAALAALDVAIAFARSALAAGLPADLLFGGDSAGGSDGGYFAYTPLSQGRPKDPFANDAYVVLVYAVILGAVWALGAALTAAPGFRLLVIADAALMIPLTTAAVMVHHPTWWALVPGVLGGLVLVAVGLLALRDRDQAHGSAPGGPPPFSPPSGPPPGWSPPA